MPLFKLRNVWNYCTYNKPFFILILILYGIIYFTQHYFFKHLGTVESSLIIGLSYIVVTGYGLTITRDRTYHGVRLPKILPKSVLVLGFKSFFVVAVYITVQYIILSLVCNPLGFPMFDLQYLLVNPDLMLYLFFTNGIENSILFLVFGSLVFYITLFFLEIALARLADTKKVLPSFNLLSIERTIGVIGWWNYTKDCTLIILAIVILTLIKDYRIPVSFLDFIVDIFLELLIFATEFLGIGAIYSQYKDKQRTSIDID